LQSVVQCRHVCGLLLYHCTGFVQWHLNEATTTFGSVSLVLKEFFERGQ
jgi:hypothetical protein